MNICQVKDIPNEPCIIFISDSQDVNQIKEDVPEAKEFDAFFVNTSDSDITELWGIYGIIPNNDKLAYKII